MKPGIFLLGPNDWDDDYRPPSPSWLRQYLDPVPAIASPKDIRRALARRIHSDSGGAWRGVVMNPEDQRGDEDDAAFFERLEEGIETYFILVPNRGKILGTLFEGGMLRRDFKWGAHPRIVLFVEKGFFKTDDEGNVSLQVKGKRTTYLASLIEVAAHVDGWENIEEAFEQMARRARAMWEP